MSNRLAAATSPYLLQHASNPVDWWPWGEEAMAEARRRDVPLLISIGYASCHWLRASANHLVPRESSRRVIDLAGQRLVPVVGPSRPAAGRAVQRPAGAHSGRAVPR